jgi:ribonuclease Z
VTIDVAQGLQPMVKPKTFLITHAHMDHASGIPYIISQKALIKAPPATFYMPQVMVEPLNNIMKEWEKIDQHEYTFEFLGVDIGQKYSLDDHHYFKPFKTFHRVPSLGYTIFESRKKLKPEYLKLSQDEIVDFKNKGVELTEEISLPIFSYTGDTTMDFWSHNPQVLESKVLFMEVTYWDLKKSVEESRKWGHIHLFEVIDRLDDFKGEKIVFTHISSRYSIEYARSILKKSIPKKHWDKVDIF